MENNINLEINKNKLDNNEFINKQNSFLESNIGKIANSTFDLGLRYILPDLIENQVIDIKNSLIEGGIKEGFSKAIEEGINFGKSVLGIITGKFDNIEQMQNAVKSGGIIDNISNVIEKVVNKQKEKGKISTNTAKIIESGKKLILDNISANIENMFTDQVNLIQKLDNHNNNWQEYFKNKNINGMEKEYKNILNIQQKIIPLENIIKNSQRIENLHNLVKNKGYNFNLTEDEMKLANVL